jgi:hypothetical protein
MSQRVVELLGSWRGWFGSDGNLEVWRMVHLSLMWCIWREYNARIFEDCERTVAKLKSMLFKTLFG